MCFVARGKEQQWKYMITIHPPESEINDAAISYRGRGDRNRPTRNGLAGIYLAFGCRRNCFFRPQNIISRNYINIIMLG